MNDNEGEHKYEKMNGILRLEAVAVGLGRVEGGSGRYASREKRDGQEQMTGNTVAVPTFY